LALELVGNIMKQITIMVSAVLLLGTFSMSSAQMKKCQSADGKWHYGDIAVAECNRTKVTTLNERGFIEKEREAPKTPQQIQEEKDQAEIIAKEEARLQAIEDERNRILSIYETEADIDRQRDNKINAVANNIKVHKAYLKSVTTKIERLKAKGASLSGFSKEQNAKEIDEAEGRFKESQFELEKLVQQKASIVERFDREKEIYLELKNRT